MRQEMAEWVTTALYVGAGRQVGDAELAVWSGALNATPDDHAEAIVTEMLRTVDFGLRPPTPALYLEHRRSWLRRHQPKNQAALEAPRTAEVASEFRRLRDQLAQAPPVVSAVPKASAAEENIPTAVRFAPTLCGEEDHSQCGSGPVRHRP